MSTRFGSALCLALLLVMAHLPAHGQAVPLSDADHVAWRAVGRVNVAGLKRRVICTGTLIAPDKVLTAAHCLYGLGRGLLASPADVHFVAGWLKGGYAAHRTGVAIQVFPGYTPGKSTTPERLAADMAIVTLEAPIASAAARPIAPAPDARPKGALSIIGYRRDRPNALSRLSGCNIRAAERRLLGLDCPVTFGTSGAPVLAETDKGWRVIGVVSAGNDGDGPVRTIAARPSAAFLNAP